MTGSDPLNLLVPGTSTHDETVRLVWRAHPRDVGEHPCLDTELHRSCDDGRDDLRPEHGARRNLHVVAELEVRGERQCLSHRDVSPSLEHHHGDGAARERVADDQLSDDAARAM